MTGSGCAGLSSGVATVQLQRHVVIIAVTTVQCILYVQYM
jgi:hypothetical protein